MSVCIQPRLLMCLGTVGRVLIHCESSCFIPKYARCRDSCCFMYSAWDNVGQCIVGCCNWNLLGVVLTGYPMEVERRDATQMNPYAMNVTRDVADLWNSLKSQRLSAALNLFSFPPVPRFVSEEFGQRQWTQLPWPPLYTPSNQWCLLKVARLWRSGLELSQGKQLVIHLPVPNYLQIPFENHNFWFPKLLLQVTPTWWSRWQVVFLPGCPYLGRPWSTHCVDTQAYFGHVDRCWSELCRTSLGERC